MKIFTEWKSTQTGIQVGDIQLLIMLRNRCTWIRFFTNKVEENHIVFDHDKKDEVVRFFYDLTEKVITNGG